MFFWLTIFWIPRIDNVFLFDAILRIFYITLPFLYELEMWVDFKGGKALNAATTIFVTLPTFFSCSSNTASFQGKTWIRDVNLTFNLHRKKYWIHTLLRVYSKFYVHPWNRGKNCLTAELLLLFRIIAAITKCCNV